MSEIFLKEDIASLLDNRFIVVIGDSIQRGVYKDLVLLLQKNKYLADYQLRAKGEMSFSGDKLIEGGQLGEMTNGVKYREVRQYQTDYHLIRFYFVTRCYNAYVESILTDLSSDPLPDVILMNSCLWDISRYGNTAVAQYKVNIKTLFKRFKEVLPPSCLVIWNSTMPISKKARGGFLIPAVEFMNSTLRLDILEANFYVHKLAVTYGFNVLDLHYFLRHQLQRRAGDGVHWDMTAHRRITNLILTHIAQAWGTTTPQHTKNLLFQNKSEGVMANKNLNPAYKRLSDLNFNFCHNDTNNLLTQPLVDPEQKRQQELINRYGGPIRNSNVEPRTPFQQMGSQAPPMFNMNQPMGFGNQMMLANQGQFVQNQGQYVDNQDPYVENQNPYAENEEQFVQNFEEVAPNFDPHSLGSGNQGNFNWEPYGQRNLEHTYGGRMYSDRIDPYANMGRRRGPHRYNPRN